MSLLPRRLIQSAISFIFVFSLLLTSFFALIARPVYAQAEPESLPCQFPIVPEEEILTHHWLANENLEPPPQVHRQTVTVIKPAGTYQISEPISFTVNFSELGALFGPTNSNYLEGKYQDQDHKSADVSSLEQTEISTYNGPGQKAGNQVMLDLQRIRYVAYIWENSHLPEASDQITDTNGDNPRRINDMVNDFNLPDTDPATSNPTPPSYGGDKNIWQNSWGIYWGKIPTTFDEFYEAYIAFREESHTNGINYIDKVLQKEYCPDWLPQEITWVIPKYFRTTTTSGQLNQIIVPYVAQSHNSNDLILQNKDDAFLDEFRSSNGILGKIIDTCLKAFKSNPVSDALKNVISSTFNLIKPIPTALAQSNQSEPPDPDNCIRVLTDGKEGQDPYCAFPTQLQDSDLDYTCNNQIDEFKLDTDNENVICTFQINWEPAHNPMQVPTFGNGPDEWDDCVRLPNNLWRCSVEVSIWPVFKIPWTTEIWNNTLFSDTEKNEPFISSEDFQRKGRPGTYSFFTPITIFETKLEELLRKCNPEVDEFSSACTEILNNLSTPEGRAEFDIEEKYPEIEICYTTFLFDPPALVSCLEDFLSSLEKKRPGESDKNSTDDLSRRFVGGADCSKEYVWHNALWDDSVQQTFGISNDCPLNAASVSRSDSDLPPPNIPECPGVEPASDGNDSNGFETSREEIVCYIIAQTSGEVETRTGLPLSQVMIRMMDQESSGNQCSIGAAGEIGVFQYIASTWKSVGALSGVDSGSVRESSSGACWGIPGEDPVAVVIPAEINPSLFSWIDQFGPDEDGEAWNPFLQVDKTIQAINAGRICEWNSFRAIFGGC